MSGSFLYQLFFTFHITNYISFFEDPADRKQTLVSESIEVNTATYYGTVVIDKTMGKSTEFRFDGQASLVSVHITNPSGVRNEVSQENGTNTFVFRPAELNQVAQR